MSITRAQQVKQLLANGGRIGLKKGTYSAEDEDDRFGGYNEPSQSSSYKAPASVPRGPGQDLGMQRAKTGPYAPGATQAYTVIGGQKVPVTPDNRDYRDFMDDQKNLQIAKDKDEFINAPPKEIETPFPIITAGLNTAQKFLPYKVTRKYYAENVIGKTYIDEEGNTKTFGLDAESYDDYDKMRKAGKINAAGRQLTDFERGIGVDRDPDPIIPIIPKDIENIDQKTEKEEEEPFERALAFRADGGRVGAMDGGMMSPEGGIMDLETGRQMYFLGKLVKKATRAVKKIVKSPIGKAALLFGIPGTGIGGLLGRASFGGKAAGLFGTEGIAQALQLGKMKAGNLLFGLPGDTGGKVAGTSLLEKIGSPMGLITAASVVSALTPAQEQEAQLLADNTGIDIEEARNQILQAAAGQDDYRARSFKAGGGIMRLGYQEGGDAKGIMKIASAPDLEDSINEMKEMLARDEFGKDLKDLSDDELIQIDEMLNNMSKIKKESLSVKLAEGGKAEPVAKKTMPLLDMDGMEKDYRETGGFVDMGRMERADDVPARLSKNEFVFTADAVRNAGEGDIDKGAEVMYNMMKNLEAGGEVSEESQGLEGARRMFQTSQRLEEVL